MGEPGSPRPAEVAIEQGLMARIEGMPSEQLSALAMYIEGELENRAAIAETAKGTENGE